jgi:D-arabinose 1-dehydrogenase-like Zn-dependent alcohol dehydrogenase
MKAITVEPMRPDTIRLEDVAEPDTGDGSVLVEAIAVGVCGTDAEIAEGKYGWPPRGKTRLVLGHESLGRVVDPGPAGRFKAGDLVVGIVRRPDPVPCPNCAVGEWDMCRNGQYTERGIKEIDGFMSERWRIEPEYAMKVDPSLGLYGVLLEPATVVTKAWEQVIAVGKRAFWEPRTVRVTGAGPIGLLAALIGKQYGLGRRERRAHYRARDRRRCDQHGAAQHRRRGQRQREQTTLVQGRRSAGPGGPRMAGAPGDAARAARELRTRSAADSGRCQGRRPVHGGVMAWISSLT